MTIEEKQKEIIDNLNLLEEWEDKYQYQLISVNLLSLCLKN
jgi:sulfur transfer protein SufE